MTFSLYNSDVRVNSALLRQDIFSPTAGDKKSKEASDIAVASEVSLADRSGKSVNIYETVNW